MALSHDTVLKHINEIEAEIKKIGQWSAKPLAPENYDFRLAFGMDTMAFAEWLQFIFIPNVRYLIETKGALPSSSQVGVKALREFDGLQEADKLVELLNDFDMLFNG